jgi:hypothetical protein
LNSGTKPRKYPENTARVHACNYIQTDSVDDYEDIPEAEQEQEQAEEAVDIRTFFPETFLWKLVVIGYVHYQPHIVS